MIVPLMASSSWVNDPIIQLLMVTRALRVFKVYRLVHFANDRKKATLFFAAKSFPVIQPHSFIFWLL